MDESRSAYKEGNIPSGDVNTASYLSSVSCETKYKLGNSQDKRLSLDDRPIEILANNLLKIWSTFQKWSEMAWRWANSLHMCRSQDWRAAAACFLRCSSNFESAVAWGVFEFTFVEGCSKLVIKESNARKKKTTSPTIQGFRWHMDLSDTFRIARQYCQRSASGWSRHPAHPTLSLC